MVDYQNPDTIFREFTALLKLWHVVNGIYIWEFFTTLYFEWEFIRGHRPYLWSIWVYSIARISTLMAVILNMVEFDTTSRINCQVLVTFEVFFAYLAFTASALLIILRILAIWNTQKIVVVIAMCIWVTDIAFFMNSTVRLRATWSPEVNTCVVLNLEATRPSIIASLTSDVVLLLIMLVGVLRLRQEGGNSFSFGPFGKILWKQGLLWLLLATIAEVPSAVFMILNLNVSLNLMFQTPCMITNTIAATRIYRSLVDYGAAKTNPPGSGRTVSDMRVRTGPIPLSKIEAAIRTERDHFPMSQSGSGSYNTTYNTTDSEEPYKIHEVSLDVDAERGPEK